MVAHHPLTVSILVLLTPAVCVTVTGMRPFIPDTDMPQYESFLEGVGLGSTAGSDVFTTSGSLSRAYR